MKSRKFASPLARAAFPALTNSSGSFYHLAFIDSNNGGIADGQYGGRNPQPIELYLPLRHQKCENFAKTADMQSRIAFRLVKSYQTN